MPWGVTSDVVEPVKINLDVYKRQIPNTIKPNGTDRTIVSQKFGQLFIHKLVVTCPVSMSLSLIHISVTDGDGNSLELHAGESILFPATTKEVKVTVEGHVKFLETYV